MSPDIVGSSRLTNVHSLSESHGNVAQWWAWSCTITFKALARNLYKHMEIRSVNIIPSEPSRVETAHAQVTLS